MQRRSDQGNSTMHGPTTSAGGYRVKFRDENRNALRIQRFRKDLDAFESIEVDTLPVNLGRSNLRLARVLMGGALGSWIGRQKAQGVLSKEVKIAVEVVEVEFRDGSDNAMCTCPVSDSQWASVPADIQGRGAQDDVFLWAITQVKYTEG